MRILKLLDVIEIAALVILTACSRHAEIAMRWMPTPECMILPGSEDQPDSIRVALLEPVDPEMISIDGNESENLLYSHLYETLIAFDCRGDARPVLAESWVSGDRGRRWKFTLREDAMFWDGSPVTAGDVARSWRDNLSDTTLMAAGIRSTQAQDDRTLIVYFDHRCRGVPGVLAAPEFAVRKGSEKLPWSLGTGPYRIARWEPGRTGSRITIIPTSGEIRPVIQFLVSSTSDMRDLINGEVDMMITSDPAVIEYAASRPQLEMVTLEWDRTYLLLSTSRVQELLLGGSVTLLPEKITDGMAQNAIRGDARGYRPKTWWDNLRTCGESTREAGEVPPLPMGSYAVSGFRRILYVSNDPIARGLAERIVALAAADPSTSAEAQAFDSVVPILIGSAHRTVAEGVTPDEFASSLREGDDFAYIISVPRHSPAPCFDFNKLVNRARWMAGDQTIFCKALVPLVDTRRHVIVRGDRIALSIDWYGNLRIERWIPRER